MSRFTYKALDPKRASVVEYTAHKSWNVTDELAADFGIKVLSGSYSSAQFRTSDSMTDGFYQSSVFNSIQHLYYSDPNNATISSDSEYLQSQERELLSYVQVFSIPSNIYGKSIHPGTVAIEAGEDYWDDGVGNLYSNAMYTSASLQYAPPRPSDTFLYLSFDEERTLVVGDDIVDNYALKYRSALPKSPVVRNGIIAAGRRSGTDPHNHPLAYKAINLPGTASIETGSESVIEIQNTVGRYFDNWNHDFAISCWVNIPVSQSVSSSFTGLFSDPLNTRQLQPHTENVIATGRGFIDNPTHNNIIPWEISVVNNSGDASEAGKIYARRGQYDDVLLLSSSISHATGGDTWTHIIFQKTGSTLQLMVNSGSTNTGGGDATWEYGNMTASLVSGTDPLNDHTITSHADICIGAQRAGYKQWKYLNDVPSPSNAISYNPAYIKPLSASIDEFIIYNNALSHIGANSQVTNKHTKTSNPIAGNIFYKHGIITLTNPFKEGAVETTDNFTLTFSGSHDITAHAYQCTVQDGEYNITLNPTARKGYSTENQYPQPFTTSSEFSPYITSIGLYNDIGELLAIGKLGQPVKSPQDFDISFVVQFDT